jgi:CTP synthase
MDKNTFYVFVTGGVVSGLGKGIASASIGSLLKDSGFNVSLMKIDPYINIDPGTQRPGEHGEVFVTEDGAETDLDLGHYERFTDIPTRKISNTTTGQIYKTVIERERKGDYQGQTVQIIPHITDEIQRRIIILGKETEADIVICEIGGTIGDIESLPFIEAIRQMSHRLGKENCCYVHLTLIPYIRSSGELKTKPTQHSVRELRELGITPDFLICRTEKKISDEHLGKISLYCNVDKGKIIQGYDVNNIYAVPYEFFKQDFHLKIIEKFGLKPKKKKEKTKWEIFKSSNPVIVDGSVKIAVVGKYTDCQDAYKSIDEALYHAGVHNKQLIEIVKIDSENLNDEEVLSKGNFNGILIPGGFGTRGFEGKILAAGFARDNNIPFFGICYGLHAAVISWARDVLNLEHANTTECSPKTEFNVIDLMEEQKSISNMGGTMRLGNYECYLGGSKNSIAHKAYAQKEIQERHRHRYEYNSRFFLQFEETGLTVTGVNPETGLAEIIEIDNKIRKHPFYIGVQFHPEFNSRPFRPHPVFREFIAAATKREKK